MAKGFYEYESFSYGDPLMERGRPQVYADLSERYGGRRSVHGTPTAEVDDSDPMIARNLRENYAYAMEQGSVAEFAMTRIPEYRMQAANAINSGFYDKAAEIKKTIGDFVSAHYADLSKWTNLRHNGEEGRKISEGVRSVLTGNYLTEWTGAKNLRGEAMSLGAFLDQNSEENRQRTIKNQAAETQLPPDVVRAISDENDPDHVIYGRFKGILSRGQQPPQYLAGGREALPDNTLKNELNTVRQLVGTYGPDREGQPPRQGLRFADVDEMGAFLDTVNSLHASDQVSPGKSFVMDLAGSWLANAPSQGDSASRLRHMHDYVQRVSDISDVLAERLHEGLDGAKQSSKIESRALRHQANALSIAFANRVAKAGYDIPLDGKEASDALAKATEDVAALKNYGIDLARDKGYADRVADIAIARLDGVPNKGLTDVATFTQTYVPLLDRLKSPREITLPDGKTMSLDAPAAWFEDMVVRAAGRAMYDSRGRNGRVYDEGAVRRSVMDAILDTAVFKGRGDYADTVAGHVVSILNGGETRSLQELMMEDTGAFDRETLTPKAIRSEGGNVATDDGFSRAATDPAGTFALSPGESGAGVPPQSVEGSGVEGYKGASQSPTENMSRASRILAGDIRDYARLRIEERNNTRPAFGSKESLDRERQYAAKVYGQMASDAFESDLSSGIREVLEDGSLVRAAQRNTTGPVTERYVPTGVLDKLQGELIKDSDPKAQWTAAALSLAILANGDSSLKDHKVGVGTGLLGAVSTRSRIRPVLGSAGIFGRGIRGEPVVFLDPGSASLHTSSDSASSYTYAGFVKSFNDAMLNLGLPPITPSGREGDIRAGARVTIGQLAARLMEHPLAKQSALVQSGFLSLEGKSLDYDAAFNWLHKQRHSNMESLHERSSGVPPPTDETQESARRVCSMLYGKNDIVRSAAERVVQHYKALGWTDKDEVASLTAGQLAKLSELYRHEGPAAVAQYVAKEEMTQVAYLPQPRVRPEDKVKPGQRRYYLDLSRVNRVVGDERTIEDAKRKLRELYNAPDLDSILAITQVEGKSIYDRELADDRKVRLEEAVTRDRLRLNQQYSNE